MPTESEINSFVFNDPNQVNSYGFRILTEGINLDRFLKNPVMLDGHYRSNSFVIGAWNNVHVSNNLLLGNPIFDVADENSKMIAGKVKRGFIKAVSMGIAFDHVDLQYIDDILTLVKCELVEVSIVAIPSNANSVCLYNTEGEIMKEEDIKILCLSLSPNSSAPKTEQPKNLNMNTITLTLPALTALGFTDTTAVGEAELSAKIIALANKAAALETSLQTLTSEKEAAILKQAADLVDDAAKKGKITADKKEVFLSLAKTDFSLAKSTLEAIPTKTSLDAQLHNSVGATEVKTKEDFLKLNLEDQLTFKADNQEQYNKLFTYKK